jgi:hypothetical protein
MNYQNKSKVNAFLKCSCLGLVAFVAAVFFNHAFAAPLSYDVIRSTGISYSSIGGSGNTLTWRNGANSDDNLSNTVPIGFSFSYQGSPVTNVLASTNGFITFNTGTAVLGSGSGAYSGANGNFSTLSVSTVAPFYDDIKCTDLTTSVKYLTTGSAGSRVFTVEWFNMTFQSGGASLNFQVKLYEGSNNIEFVYGAMNAFDGSFNQTYSYSSGINASSITAPPASGELLTQQTGNTRNFGFASANSLTIVPQCYSSILFTPGTYTPYVPGSTIPANDEPAGAFLLPVNSSPCVDLCGTFYTSAGATVSAVSACTSPSPSDVWFKFTATNSSTTIKVRGSGGYDAVVQLLDNSLNSITCQNAMTSGLTETITSTSLVIGNLYYVRVYHAAGGSGTNGVFSICINATPVAPSNDDCSGAISLGVTSSQTLIAGTNTIAATASSVAVSCSTPDDDVWYKFIANTSSATVFIQGQSGFDPAVQLFSGTCGSLVSLQCVNSNTTMGSSETLNLSNLVLNSTYFIRVYHANAGSGTGNFSLVVYSNPPVCPTPNVFSPSSINYVAPSGTNLRWAKSSNTSSYDVYLDTLSAPVHFLANVTDTSIFTGTLLQGKTYYWRVVAKNAVGNSPGCDIHLFATTPADLVMTVRIFIQGYYIGNRTMAAVVNPDLYPNITDTITVSLARNIAPYDIIYSTKTLLKTNGDARCSFPYNSGFQNYYIVVNHRNSIETWSYQPFGFLIDYGDTIFDFTTSVAAGNHRPANGTNSQLIESQNSYSRERLDLINRNTPTELRREE